MVATDSESRYAVLFCQQEDSCRSADGIVADRWLTEADRLMKVPASKQDLALTGEIERVLVCCTEAVRLGVLAVAARSVAVEPEVGCCTEVAPAVLLAAGRLAALVDRSLPEVPAVWLAAGRKKLVEQTDGELDSGTDSKTNTAHLAQRLVVPGATGADSLGLG